MDCGSWRTSRKSLYYRTSPKLVMSDNVNSLTLMRNCNRIFKDKGVVYIG